MGSRQKMRVISILSALLLSSITVQAEPQDEPKYQLVSKASTRHSFIQPLLISPRKAIQKAVKHQKRDTNPLELGSLNARQIFTCPRGFVQCEEAPDWCCGLETTCILFPDSSQVICCPDGIDCQEIIDDLPDDILGGCDMGEVVCPGGTDCCPPGSTCLESSSGTILCDISGGGDPTGGEGDGDDDMCGPEFELCPNIPGGCCPNGVECIPPDRCNRQCTINDTPCGAGCCADPLVCGSDGNTCVEPGNPDEFTSINPSSLSLPTRTRSVIPTETDSGESSESIPVLRPTPSNEDESATVTSGINGESTPTGDEDEFVVTITRGSGDASKGELGTGLLAAGVMIGMGWGLI